MALEAGADDFLSKPFNRVELMARLHAGMRILNLHRALTDRIQELEESRQREHHLRTLTPICWYCKKIRGDKDDWEPIDQLPRRARLPLHARGLPVVPRRGRRRCRRCRASSRARQATGRPTPDDGPGVRAALAASVANATDCARSPARRTAKRAQHAHPDRLTPRVRDDGGLRSLAGWSRASRPTAHLARRPRAAHSTGPGVDATADRLGARMDCRLGGGRSLVARPPRRRRCAPSSALVRPFAWTGMRSDPGVRARASVEGRCAPLQGGQVAGSSTFV